MLPGHSISRYSLTVFSIAVVSALLYCTWVVLPAAAMAPNQAYDLVQPYPEYLPRGPKNALGIVLWNSGFFGRGVKNSYPPPMAIKALVTHGWDAITIDRNPMLDGGWLSVGLQHVNYVVQQIVNAQQYGYARVILAGQTYGASIALEAAIKAPVYGVIAMTPGKSAGEARMADNVQYTLAQAQRMQSMRALFVLPPDDEMLPGFDQAPAVRQALNARGMPYMMVDRQVHGQNGAYSAAFWPYASCGVVFFSPAVTPRAGEFECYRDELMPLAASFGLNLQTATTVWMGYLQASGQPVIVAEHRTSSGSTVDFAIGVGLLGRGSAKTMLNLPAKWTAGQLGFWLSRDDAMTLYRSSGSDSWSFKASKTSGGDWAGTMMLLLAAR